MTTQTYQQLIMEGVKGLPPNAMAEIADFIYFVRKRVLQPQTFEQELETILLEVELKQLGQAEQNHLEQEFENYDQLYPCE